MEEQITISALQKQLDEVNRQLEQVEDKLVQESAARERAEGRVRKPQIWTRLTAAVVLVALALWGGGLSAPLLVATIVIILIVLVGLDVTRRLLNPLTAQAESG